MIMDMAMNIMENLIKEIKTAEPEQREHFTKSAVTLLEISLETLKISPEFRQAFGMVHSEFLKHPESRDTLEQGAKAYSEYIH